MQRVLEYTVQVYDALPAIAGATSNLTTLANVREVLGLAASDTADDAYLTNLIGRISEAIKKYTRRSLTQTTVTEIHDGHRRPTLRLRDYPVISFTSLHEDPDQVWDSTTLVDSSDYVVDTRLGWVHWKYYGQRFQRYPQSIRAIYVAGYASIPLELEDATIQMVVSRYRRRRNEAATARSKGDESLTFRTEAGLLEHEQRILERYRRRVS